MSVLLWVVLLLRVRGSNSDKASSLMERTCETESYCISLSKETITSEAGLCVMVPCSFTTDPDFNVIRVIWLKCNRGTGRCDKHYFSNKNIQAGFEGRASLLEPDLRLKNCSIIINDLKTSDSGSYQLRLAGNKKQTRDGFTFTSKAAVKVTGLSQTPTVTVPPLTAGQQSTLTCTAPGLCSGSAPEITWTWRRAGEEDSHITGNITAVRTETLTAVAQRHSSTLTFAPSAEHHGTEVTCKVSFTGNITTEETVTLHVAYVTKLKLTCSVGSFPAPFITRSKCGCGEQLNAEALGGSASLIIHNVTADRAELYIFTETHQNNRLTAQMEVTVTYTKDFLNINWSQVFVVFCIGILLSATIACLTSKIHRRNNKNSGNLAEYMADLTMGAGEKVDGAEETEEAEYSEINLVKMEKRNLTNAKQTPDTEESEYTKVKREVMLERLDNAGEDGERVAGIKVEEGARYEHRGAEQCVLVRKGKSVELYSTITEIKHQL